MSSKKPAGGAGTGGKGVMELARLRISSVQTADAPAPESPDTKPQRRSILSKPLKQVFETRNYSILPVSLDRLPVVLDAASPFLAPLSVPTFLELLYLECRANPEMMARAKAQKWPDAEKRNSDYEDQPTKKGKSGPPKPKKTTARIDSKVADWITRTLYPAKSDHLALSLFLEWSICDWEWISQNLTYRGRR